MRGTLGEGAPLAVTDLGTMGYREALELQHRVVEARRSGEIGRAHV